MVQESELVATVMRRNGLVFQFEERLTDFKHVPSGTCTLNACFFKVWTELCF